MIVSMGIDQSLTCTGVVILRHYNDQYEVLHVEAISTTKTGLEDYADTLDRAIRIADRLVEISKEFEVTDYCIEGLSFGSAGNATRNLAMLMAIICLKLEITNPYTVPPTTLKKYATGNGRADKKAMLASIEQENEVLFNYLNPMTIKAGKYDLADAYYLSKHLLENNLTKQGK